jgi:CheY-like chemotaxis protein
VPSWNEDHLVPIFRNGRIEEVYWTYGYSPVYDDEGRVGGTLVVCTETTARVLAERRVGIIRSLAVSLLSARDTSDVTARVAAVLASAQRDVPFAMIAWDNAAPVTVGLAPPRGGSSVPAIALTAYARAEDAERALRSGFQEHIAKPVDAWQLLDAVSRWTEARGERDGHEPGG